MYRLLVKTVAPGKQLASDCAPGEMHFVAQSGKRSKQM
jgi:hypothetical protein